MMNQKHNKKLLEQKKSANNYLKYSSLAFQLVVIICAGVFGGILLDKKINVTFPLFTVSLSIISIILSLYYVVKDFTKMNK